MYNCLLYFSRTFPTSEDNVCVVSIVGKSVYNPYYNKAATLNPFIGKQVFNVRIRSTSHHKSILYLLEKVLHKPKMRLARAPLEICNCHI